MTIGPLPKMKQAQIGLMTVNALVDSVGLTRTPEELFKNPPRDLFEREQSWLVPNYGDAATQRLVLAYQSFLVTLGDTQILVDCAVGEDGNFPVRPDWHRTKSNWLNHLGQCGLAPEDIDAVVLTHLHMDHTGWLTRLDCDEWRPTFPNAVHMTTQTELDYWTSSEAAFEYMSTSIEDSIRPVLDAGLLKCIVPETEIAEGLFTVDLAGHSPGMIGLEYRKNGRVVASFCADLMHHPLQVAEPDVCTAFCFDPLQAASIRRKKLAEYAHQQTIVFCGHFPGQSAGRIEDYEPGFRFAPLD